MSSRTFIIIFDRASWINVLFFVTRSRFNLLAFFKEFSQRIAHFWPVIIHQFNNLDLEWWLWHNLVCSIDLEGLNMSARAVSFVTVTVISLTVQCHCFPPGSIKNTFPATKNHSPFSKTSEAKQYSLVLDICVLITCPEALLDSKIAGSQTHNLLHHVFLFKSVCHHVIWNVTGIQTTDAKWTIDVILQYTDTETY